MPRRSLKTRCLCQLSYSSHSQGKRSPRRVRWARIISAFLVSTPWAPWGSRWVWWWFAVPRIDKGELVCSCWWPELYLRGTLFFSEPFSFLFFSFFSFYHFMVWVCWDCNWSILITFFLFFSLFSFFSPLNHPTPPPLFLLLFWGTLWRLF